MAKIDSKNFTKRLGRDSVLNNIDLKLEKINGIQRQILEVNYFVSKREVSYFLKEPREHLFTVTNPVYVPKIGETITIKTGDEFKKFEVISTSYEIDKTEEEAIESLCIYLAVKIS